MQCGGGPCLFQIVTSILTDLTAATCWPRSSIRYCHIGSLDCKWILSLCLHRSRALTYAQLGFNHKSSIERDNSGMYCHLTLSTPLVSDLFLVVHAFLMSF